MAQGFCKLRRNVCQGSKVCMSIWGILGIEPTKDKSIIKQAYRKRLQAVNPEDDAQGFMELREAYEHANKLADIDDASLKEDEMSPLEQKIDALYQDFSRRITVLAWEALLDEDAFVALDSSEDSFIALIHYLMKHYYLPKRVWQYLVTKFEIRERKRELSEQFTAEFIDYMINNATYDDLISYDLFEGDMSKVDTYLSNYYRLDAAIRKYKKEEFDKLFCVLASGEVSHPYLEIARIRVALQELRDEANLQKVSMEELVAVRQEKVCTFEKTAQALQELYPSDITILHICGDLALVQNHYEEAKKYYDQTLAFAKDNYIVKGKQADLAFCMGDYVKARDLYLELLRINHYDNHVRAGMMRANACLIEQYKEKLKGKNDSDICIEMAWSYYQSYHFEEAIASIKDVRPVGKQVFEFYNVRGRSYLCLGSYEKALDDFFCWREAVEGLENNGEENDKLRKRMPYINFLIADCYLKTKQYDKSRKYLELALSTKHDELVLSYEARCELEFKTHNYEACIDACNDLIANDDRSFIAYIFMAKSNYELNYYKEALVACERAIALYPYIAEPYGIEAHIYIKAGYRELAEQMLDRFRTLGIESDELDFCDACILELDNKHAEIVALLTKTVERSKTIHTDKEDFEEIFMMLAFHMEKLEQYEEAAIYYEKVCEKNEEHPVVYGRLGITYKKLGKLDKALTCINKQISIRKHPLYFIEQGLILQYMGDDRAALKSFELVLSYDSKNVFCLMRIGAIYEAAGKFQTALTCYRKAHDNCDEVDIENKKLLHADIARVLQCMNMQEAGAFEKSEQEYIAYIEKYDKNPNIIYDYAELLCRMRNPRAALHILMECISDGKYDTDDRQMCARQYISICGREGMLRQVKEMSAYLLSEHFLIHPKTYAVIGRSYLDNGNINYAIASFEKAVALDKKNKENYYSDLMDAMHRKHFLTQKSIDILFNKAVASLKRLYTPYDCIKAAIVYQCKHKSKEAFQFIDKALKMRRCKGCFYSRCHEALFQKALLFEENQDYQSAKLCLQEAIAICGHNHMYEQEYKRILNKKSR